MKYPDGMLFIYHKTEDGVNLEQKDLIMCRNCEYWINRNCEYWWNDSSSEEDFCSKAKKRSRKEE